MHGVLKSIYDYGQPNRILLKCYFIINTDFVDFTKLRCHFNMKYLNAYYRILFHLWSPYIIGVVKESLNEDSSSIYVIASNEELDVFQSATNIIDRKSLL